MTVTNNVTISLLLQRYFNIGMEFTTLKISDRLYELTIMKNFTRDCCPNTQEVHKAHQSMTSMINPIFGHDGFWIFLDFLICYSVVSF